MENQAPEYPTEYPLLIAVSDPEQRDFIARALQPLERRLLWAGDGGEALRLAETEQPAIILTGLRLPDMTGLALCHQVRESPSLAATLVLLIADAALDSLGRAEAMEQGVHGVFTFPLSPQEMAARVRTFLRLKQTESDLLQTREQYRRLLAHANKNLAMLNALLESVDTPVLLLDGQARLMTFNQYFADFSRKVFDREPAEEMFNQEDIPGGILEQALPFYRRALAGEAGVQYLTVGTGDKASFYEVVYQPVLVQPSDVPTLSAKAGEVIGVSIFMLDMTERWRAQQALQDYSARLEAEVEARTQDLRLAQEKLVRQERLAVLGQLSSSVGHELRNPLSVMGQAIYYLKHIQQDAPPAVSEYLNIISTEILNAERIVADLLDYSRARALTPEHVRLGQVVNEVLRRYNVPGNVTASLEIPEDLPEIYADARHIVQVLGNLVTNACQAMPEGGRLVIKAAPTTHNGQLVVAVQVQDSGVGIPTDQLPLLFEPLYTTRARGIGLGLSICKKLVEANGGSISVESRPGLGSTFTTLWPVSPPAETPVKHSPPVLDF